MRFRNFLFSPAGCALIALVAAFSFSAVASASVTTITGTTIYYSDVSGTSLSYTDITETPTRMTSASTASAPVFGQPTGGDMLSFPGLSFNAVASGAGAFDVADSKLSMTISTASTAGITQLILSEYGDYTLVHTLGSTSPSASYAANGWVTISEIYYNGTTISGLGIVVSDAFSQTLTLASGDYLDTNAWSGTLTFDLASALAAAGYEGATVTEATFTVDNTLTALSFDDYGGAYIAKKAVTISTVSVPEPMLFGLSMLGVIFLGIRTKRRK